MNAQEAKIPKNRWTFSSLRRDVTGGPALGSAAAP
jgi:hypothetical protein